MACLQVPGPEWRYRCPLGSLASERIAGESPLIAVTAPRHIKRRSRPMQKIAALPERIVPPALGCLAARLRAFLADKLELTGICHVRRITRFGQRQCPQKSRLGSREFALPAQDPAMGRVKTGRLLRKILHGRARPLLRVCQQQFSRVTKWQVEVTGRGFGIVIV